MNKSRHELPVMAKLDLQFDPEFLVEAFREFTSNKKWDGLGSEYKTLCENHTKLPKMFFTSEELEGLSCISELEWAQASYKQMSLTDFDPEFRLSGEGLGSRWSTRIALGKVEADERWFRKIKPDVPDYFRYVIEQVGGAHRTRFASLSASSMVDPHFDYDTTYGIRLHIAITTNPECRNGGWTKSGELFEQHIPADGSVWFVNPGLKHFARNMGDTERVHLIISTESQQLLDGIL